MGLGENRYLYLYGVLTLLGTSSDENIFFLDKENLFQCEKIGGRLCVINFVVPQRAKVILIIEDKLSLDGYCFYRNGLPFTLKQTPLFAYFQKKEYNIITDI